MKISNLLDLIFPPEYEAIKKRKANYTLKTEPQNKLAIQRMRLQRIINDPDLLDPEAKNALDQLEKIDAHHLESVTGGTRG